jgi:hypothetical protein
VACIQFNKGHAIGKVNLLHAFVNKMANIIPVCMLHTPMYMLRHPYFGAIVNGDDMWNSQIHGRFKGILLKESGIVKAWTLVNL